MNIIGYTGSKKKKIQGEKMSDNGIGYYTKEEKGKIKLYIGIGDGVLMYEGTFNDIEEVDRYIEENEGE